MRVTSEGIFRSSKFALYRNGDSTDRCDRHAFEFRIKTGPQKPPLRTTQEGTPRFTQESAAEEAIAEATGVCHVPVVEDGALGKAPTAIGNSITVDGLKIIRPHKAATQALGRASNQAASSRKTPMHGLAPVSGVQRRREGFQVTPCSNGTGR